MAVFNLFSKRQKKLRGEISDVYTYDEIPEALRVQIVHIIRDTIGDVVSDYSEDKPKQAYKFIHDILCREYGVFSLGNNREEDESAVLNYILSNDDIERVMDVVELSFRYIVLRIGVNEYAYTRNTTVKLKPNEAVEELNERFKENAVGFQFESGEIIRIDSTFIHNQITKPTLGLLHNRKFAGANEEYLKAHEHYRHGRNKECLNECLKAFESTLKIICKEKGWDHSETDTSKKLI